MRRTPTILWIRQLIWVYFLLLIFEGVLRKWIVPSLSNPLLLVRDPVVILIYLLAMKERVFVWNKWVICCVLLSFVCLFAGLFVLEDSLLVPLFGFRADFLHLPLIFVIPRVFNSEDVKKIGFWTLIFCIPMALLMALQFQASPTAWINAGAGENSMQIDAAEGHIRPAGTFSFITGPAAFFPFAAAFLLVCQLSKIQYPRLLQISSAVAVLIGAAVSSSRGLLASTGIVLACAVLAGIVLKPLFLSQSQIVRNIQAAALLCIVLLVTTQFSVVDEGTHTFNTRINNAGQSEGGGRGFVNRALNEYTGPMELISTTPLLGKGLGLGTNGGSALVNNGQAKFLLAEGEWARVILESGPVLGVTYLLLRLVLVLWILLITARQAKQGNPLPFLLLGSCATLLLNGQFGQPTEQGFAVLGSGLALAAMRVPKAVPVASRSVPMPDREPLRYAL